MRDPGIRINIAKQLKAARKRAGLSVEETSMLLETEYGISKNIKTIYGWEQCNALPDAETLICLLKLYDAGPVSDFAQEATKPIVRHPLCPHYSDDEIRLIDNYRYAGKYKELIGDIAEMVAHEINY